MIIYRMEKRKLIYKLMRNNLSKILMKKKTYYRMKMLKMVKILKTANLLLKAKKQICTTFAEVIMIKKRGNAFPMSLKSDAELPDKMKIGNQKHKRNVKRPLLRRKDLERSERELFK